MRGSRLSEEFREDPMRSFVDFPVECGYCGQELDSGFEISDHFAEVHPFAPFNPRYWIEGMNYE